MNTIPLTSSPFQNNPAGYTVIGSNAYGKDKPKHDDVSLILLHRSSRIYKPEILRKISEYDFREILLVEAPDRGFDIEGLSRQFPFVKFLLLNSSTSHGEQVNASFREISSPWFLVSWSDMSLPSFKLIKKQIEKLKEKQILCSAPQISGVHGELLPTVQVPISDDRTLKVLSMISGEGEVPTLFAFDYVGLYNSHIFASTGGYDPCMRSDFWQKMDFGLRSFMWGEQILTSTHLRLKYLSEPPVEDTSVDNDYNIFFLKNLSVKIGSNGAYIPKKSIISYIFHSGVDICRAVKHFNQVRKWVSANSGKFVRVAARVMDIWEEKLG